MSRPKITRLRRGFGNTKVPISATALTLSGYRNGGNVLNRTTIAGAQTLTLPAATGKGGQIRVFIGVTATGNKIIKAAGSDVIQGVADVSGTTAGTFGTASNTNTITLNGTTTGGIVGSLVELIDTAAGVWGVKAHLDGSGTAATPFSNT